MHQYKLEFGWLARDTNQSMHLLLGLVARALFAQLYFLNFKACPATYVCKSQDKRNRLSSHGATCCTSPSSHGTTCCTSPSSHGATCCISPRLSLQLRGPMCKKASGPKCATPARRKVRAHLRLVRSIRSRLGSRGRRHSDTSGICVLLQCAPHAASATVVAALDSALALVSAHEGTVVSDDEEPLACS